MKLNKIWIIATINIVLISMIFINSSIFLGNPNNDDRISGRAVQFNWEGTADNYLLYLDDNPEFTSPEIKEVKNPELLKRLTSTHP